MVNVDGNERMVIRYLTGEADLDETVAAISVLPVQKQALVFRGCSDDEVRNRLCALRSTVASVVGESRIVGSTNNRMGRDLTCVETGEELEIKIGNKTTANIGLGTAGLLLPSVVMDIVGSISIPQRRLLATTESGRNELMNSRAVILESIFRTSQGVSTSEEQNELLSRFFSGAHREDSLLAGSPPIPYSTIYPAVANVNTSWLIEKSPVYCSERSWTFRAALSDKRVQLFAVDQFGNRIRFVLNQKNRFSVADNSGEIIKLGWDYMVNQLSFNVWVYPVE